MPALPDPRPARQRYRAFTVYQYIQLLFGQHNMRQSDRNRSLADVRGDAPEAPGADEPHLDYPWAARLEVMRRARQRSPGNGETIGREVRTNPDEAMTR
jgi:hypothetical protein